MSAHDWPTAERIKTLLHYDPDTGNFKWKVYRAVTAKAGYLAGNTDTRGHSQIRIDGRLYQAHRIAFLYMTGKVPDDQVDHINGVRNDNRWCNLRLANANENARNAKLRSDNKSGVKGVFFNKLTEKYQASIRFNGKLIHLGVFKNIEDATRIRESAAIKYHGEFANHGT